MQSIALRITFPMMCLDTSFVQFKQKLVKVLKSLCVEFTPIYFFSFRYKCLVSYWKMLQCTDVNFQVILLYFPKCNLYFAVSQFIGNTHTRIYLTPLPTAEPFITNFSSTPNTIVGDNLRVECEIRGIPTPVISWLKDDKPLTSGSGIEFFTPSGDEFLSRVNIPSATLANDGTYTCVGENAAGSISMEIIVEVVTEALSM